MTDTTPAQPMTRRERRLLEEQGLLPGAPQSSEQSVQSSPEPVAMAPEAPPPPPTPVPMTRRERRLLEETGVIPIPVETPEPAPTSALADTSLVEVTQTAPEEPSAGPVEPLPPVFGPPATSPVPAVAEDTAPEPVPQASTPPEAPRQEAPPPPEAVPSSRVVGDVTMATSSLILPTTPIVDMAGPIGDTGEIIVTGQITVPHRLAETGSIPVLREDIDDDERFDSYVTGELTPMSQPIRASKAVSGQGDDTDILLVRRVRWGTAAILTATGAAVLGVGAVVLLVVALLTDTLV